MPVIFEVCVFLNSRSTGGVISKVNSPRIERTEGIYCHALNKGGSFSSRIWYYG